MLSHPHCDLRDTSRHRPFRALSDGKTPALRKLAAALLHVDIQQGEHSSVRAAAARSGMATMAVGGALSLIRRRSPGSPPSQVEDARVAMLLYQRVAKDWEQQHRRAFRRRRRRR